VCVCVCVCVCERERERERDAKADEGKRPRECGAHRLLVPPGYDRDAL
jgi:hypothetical protein